MHISKTHDHLSAAEERPLARGTKQVVWVWKWMVGVAGVVPSTRWLA